MRTVVNIEVSVTDYMRIRDTMKYWASWLEDSISKEDEEARQAVLKALKAMEDSAEIINYKD